MSIWPGTKGKRFYTVQMAEGSDEEHKHPVSPAVTDRFTGFSAIPLFHAALQATAKMT